MTNRNAVKRLIETQGPAAARHQFGDAIVTDVIVNGVRAYTKDCGDGPCSCGGHSAVKPARAPAKDAYREEYKKRLKAEVLRRVLTGFSDAMDRDRQSNRLQAFLSSGRRAH